MTHAAAPAPGPPSRIERLDDAQLAAYLARIGMGATPAPTDASLRELQLAHLLSVPFENLSIHLDEPISLRPDALFDKIVVRRRGGFCYELNGLFAALLHTLGFDVTMLAAQVYRPGGVSPPFAHLALLVDGWLVDVGFGRNSAYPLRWDRSTAQDDPCGVFRLASVADGDVEVSCGDELHYRLETRPRALEDFVPTCWWQQTHPDSRFRAGPTCSLLAAGFGRVTLAGRTLVTTEDGRRTEAILDTDADVLAAYRDRFGVVLDRVPTAPAGGRHAPLS